MARMNAAAGKPAEYIPAKRVDPRNEITGQLFPNLPISKRTEEFHFGVSKNPGRRDPVEMACNTR
jgi:hypothetical protein